MSSSLVARKRVSLCAVKQCKQQPACRRTRSRGWWGTTRSVSALQYRAFSWDPNVSSDPSVSSSASTSTTTTKDSSTAESKADVLKLNSAGRHIFLCCDQSKAKCCSFPEGMASWNHLKKRSRELNTAFTAAGDDHKRFVRTKANCLQVCRQGPVAVVYPDGVWYKNVDVAALEEIIVSHLVGGVPVPKYIIPNAGQAVKDKQRY